MLETKPASILIVDDDPAMILALRHVLADVGQIRFAVRGLDALRLIAEETPDVVLLDAEMPGMSGFEVCDAIHADGAHADLPVIFVTSHSDAAYEESGFRAGAVDFIAKPIHPRIVQARVMTHLRLRRANERLRAEATTDGLTQLRNRRAFDAALRDESARALRAGQPLSLLMVDVDHFKLYNDHYGHAAGDECLRRVAAVLEACTSRAGDMVARHGGEEFAVILPAADMAGGQRVAGRMLSAVRAAEIPQAYSPVAPMSPCRSASARSTRTVRCGAGPAPGRGPHRRRRR